MRIDTKAFGKININQEDILTFIGPILGFEDVKKYVVLHDKENSGPFFWLQAIEKPEPAFVVIEPKLVCADYSPVMSKEVLSDLELDDPNDLRQLVIVRIPEKISDISVNLKAPVIINSKKGLAKQIVLEDKRYQTRHYLVSNNKGGGSDAGTNP